MIISRENSQKLFISSKNNCELVVYWGTYNCNFLPHCFLFIVSHKYKICDRMWLKPIKYQMPGDTVIWGLLQGENLYVPLSAWEVDIHMLRNSNNKIQTIPLLNVVKIPYIGRYRKLRAIGKLRPINFLPVMLKHEENFIKRQTFFHQGDTFSLHISCKEFQTIPLKKYVNIEDIFEGTIVCLQTGQFRRYAMWVHDTV